MEIQERHSNINKRQNFFWRQESYVLSLCCSLLINGSCARSCGVFTAIEEFCSCGVYERSVVPFDPCAGRQNLAGNDDGALGIGSCSCSIGEADVASLLAETSDNAAVG